MAGSRHELQTVWHRREERCDFMFCVYVLRNVEGKYYIGVTAKLAERINKHNQQGSRWTKHKGSWSLVYQKEFETKYQAITYEKKLKSYKGGNALKGLLGEVA